MKVKKLNASSKRTNDAIRESFAELIREKGSFSHITVTDLVKKCGITRAAFYTHYESIYEVAQELQDETLDILVKNIEKVKSLDDIELYIDKIFEYLKSNEKIYHMILSSSDPLLFTARLNKYMNKEISNILSKKKDKDLLMRISFFCDGSMSLIIKYFRNSIDLTLDEVKRNIKDIADVLFKAN